MSRGGPKQTAEVGHFRMPKSPVVVQIPFDIQDTEIEVSTADALDTILNPHVYKRYSRQIAERIVKKIRGVRVATAG